MVIVILTALILSCAVALTSIGDVHASYDTSDKWKTEYDDLEKQVNESKKDVEVANNTANSLNKSIQDSNKKVDDYLKAIATQSKALNDSNSNRVSTLNTYRKSLNRFNKLKVNYRNTLQRFGKRDTRSLTARKNLIESRTVAKQDKRRALSARNRYSNFKSTLTLLNSQLAAELGFRSHNLIELNQANINLANALSVFSDKEGEFNNANDVLKGIQDQFNELLKELYDDLLYDYVNDTSNINVTELAEDNANLKGLFTDDTGYEKFIAAFEDYFNGILGNRVVSITDFINNATAKYLDNFTNILMNEYFGHPTDSVYDYLWDVIFFDNSLTDLADLIDSTEIDATNAAYKSVMDYLNEKLDSLIEEANDSIAKIDDLNEKLDALTEANNALKTAASTDFDDLDDLLDDVNEIIDEIKGEILTLNNDITNFKNAHDNMDLDTLLSVINAVDAVTDQKTQLDSVISTFKDSMDEKLQELTEKYGSISSIPGLSDLPEYGVFSDAVNKVKTALII